MVKKIRFQCTATGTYTITKKNILQLYVMAATASTSFRLWRSARVLKVEAWGQPAQLGAATLETSITGVGVGPENCASDMSTGVTPAHVVWRPAQHAQNGMWFQSGANEADGLFALAVSSFQTVVDLTVEVIFADQFDPAVAGEVPAAATAGTIYMDYLDGLSSGKFQPVDYVPLP